MERIGFVFSETRVSNVGSGTIYCSLGSLELWSGSP